MSEKRFEVDGVEVERFMLVFGDDGTRVVDNQTGKELYAIDVVDLLNEQQDTIGEQKIAIDELITDYKKLEKENEQLRKQIQNYKQLIANSYVGEEETLDGFTGKYVIWENELQTELDISKGGE